MDENESPEQSVMMVVKFKDRPFRFNFYCYSKIPFPDKSVDFLEE